MGDPTEADVSTSPSNSSEPQASSSKPNSVPYSFNKAKAKSLKYIPKGTIKDDKVKIAEATIANYVFQKIDCLDKNFLLPAKFLLELKTEQDFLAYYQSYKQEITGLMEILTKLYRQLNAIKSPDGTKQYYAEKINALSLSIQTSELETIKENISTTEEHSNKQITSQDKPTNELLLNLTTKLAELATDCNTLKSTADQFTKTEFFTWLPQLKLAVENLRKRLHFINKEEFSDVKIVELFEIEFKTLAENISIIETSIQQHHDRFIADEKALQATIEHVKEKSADNKKIWKHSCQFQQSLIDDIDKLLKKYATPEYNAWIKNAPAALNKITELKKLSSELAESLHSANKKLRFTEDDFKIFLETDDADLESCKAIEKKLETQAKELNSFYDWQYEIREQIDATPALFKKLAKNKSAKIAPHLEIIHKKPARKKLKIIELTDNNLIDAPILQISADDLEKNTTQETKQEMQKEQKKAEDADIENQKETATDKVQAQVEQDPFQQFDPSIPDLSKELAEATRNEPQIREKKQEATEELRDQKQKVVSKTISLEALRKIINEKRQRKGFFSKVIDSFLKTFFPTLTWQKDKAIATLCTRFENATSPVAEPVIVSKVTEDWKKQYTEILEKPRSFNFFAKSKKTTSIEIYDALKDIQCEIAKTAPRPG